MMKIFVFYFFFLHFMVQYKIDPCALSGAGRKRSDDMPVSEFRETLAEGIGYTEIVDEKFKTNTVQIRMLTDLSEQTAAVNALVMGVLSTSNSQDRTLTELTTRMNTLYGTNLGTDVSKRGDTQILSLHVNAVDDRFALEGEAITREAVSILLTCLFSPNAQNGAFDESIFRARKKDLLDSIEAEINNKRSYAILQAQRTAFAGEPGGVPAYGVREIAETITPASAYAAYEALLQSAQIEIYCVGSRPMPEVKAQLAEAFGRVKRAPKLMAFCAPSPCKGTVETVTEPMDVSQSKLVMAFKSDCTDREGMRLMNVIFGATPFSKLFLNVREKLSLCYYCASNYNVSKQTLLVDCGIEAENLEKAKAEILNQLHAVQNGDFTDEEIDNGALSIANAVRGVGDTPLGWINWYFTHFCLGQSCTPEEEAAALREQIAKRAEIRERILRAAKSLTLDTVYFMQQKEGQ